MRELFLIPIAQAGVITDAPKISTILVNVLNFLLSIVSVVAIIAIVIAGIIYLTSAGNEERMRLGKRILVAALIGLAISLGALVIINLFVSFFG